VVCAFSLLASAYFLVPSPSSPVALGVPIFARARFFFRCGLASVRRVSFTDRGVVTGDRDEHDADPAAGTKP